MKSFAVLAGLSAVAAAQNATVAPALGSITVSTATYTSCSTLAPGGTVTGLITVVEPCTHYQCTASKTAAVMPAFTTSYSTVYTMYCPTATASSYLQAYTTTIYETCSGASATFSAGQPGYVPSGWTTGVVTCTECGATPVSSLMTFPTSAPSGAVVPPNMPAAPATATATPATAAPGTPAASPAASAGTPAAAPSSGASSCPGGADCPSTGSGSGSPAAAPPSSGASTCPGGANCPATGSGSSSPAAPGSGSAAPAAPAAGSVCPGGVKCPAAIAGKYSNGTAAAVPAGPTATGASMCPGGSACPTSSFPSNSSAVFMGAAGRSAAVGQTLGAAVVLAVAGMLL